MYLPCTRGVLEVARVYSRCTQGVLALDSTGLQWILLDSNGFYWIITDSTGFIDFD